MTTLTCHTATAVYGPKGAMLHDYMVQDEMRGSRQRDRRERQHRGGCVALRLSHCQPASDIPTCR
jgi:hypothetical protein